MTLTPGQLGLIRGLGFTLLTALLAFLGDAANLNGIVSLGTATIISSLALSFEHYLEAQGKGALFGSVNKHVQ